MKTDPTSNITGAAGTPLSYHSIELGKRATSQPNVKSKSDLAISDTVETSDREADGRRDLDSDQLQPGAEQISRTSIDCQPGSLLDLEG